jgi:hypothetical protein
MEVVTEALCIILVVILFLMTRPDAVKSRIKQLLNKMPGPPTYPIIGTAWEFITSPIQRKCIVFLTGFCNGIGLRHSIIYTDIQAGDVMVHRLT